MAKTYTAGQILHDITHTPLDVEGCSSDYIGVWELSPTLRLITTKYQLLDILKLDSNIVLGGFLYDNFYYQSQMSS